ncbi:MAG TPA: hypothetical protein P5349_02690 [Tenuifilaceae bacterium]|nr:hypothetical protein [Tenuifilaceae bacterium]
MQNKKIAIFVFTLLMAFNPNLKAQDWNLLFTYESDAEYYMADGNYAKAADTYLKAIKKLPESANLKFKAGYCMLKTSDRKMEAGYYLEEAAKKVTDKYDARSLKEESAPPEAFYQLGIYYLIKNEFDKATNTFNEYKKYLNPKDELANQLVNMHIKSCEFAKELIKSPVGLSINPLSDIINTTQDNIDPVLSADGKTLAYTTITPTGNKIFISYKQEDVWGKPIDITRQLGSKYLTTSFLSETGEELYLIENDARNSQIVVSFKKKSKWSKTVDVAKPINSKSNEKHVCVTSDGNTVYFTSDRKGGQGGYDIWMTTVSDGRWGEPVNLGPNINTPLDEASPFLTPDEKYLFFTSQGHNSIGGFDVFYIKLDGTSEVKNVGYPLNTTDDEQFYFPIDLTTGLISRYNQKWVGGMDIASVEITPLVDVKINVMLASNASTTKPYDISILKENSNEAIYKSTEKGQKQLTQKLMPGTYKVIAQSPDFKETESDLVIPKKPAKSEFQISLVLNPLEVKPEPIAAVSEPPKEETKVSEQPQKVEVVQQSTPKKEVVEKPKEEPKHEPVKPKVEKSKPSVPKVRKVEKVVTKPSTNFNIASTTSTNVATTYSVQIAASQSPLDYTQIHTDSLFVTISPEGYYRYSVGNTRSVEDADALMQKIKAQGINNAWVRINREHPGYTIQFIALKAPKSVSAFSELGSVMVYKTSSGIFRYCVGKYKTPEDAITDINRLASLGYNGAFVRELGR